MFERAKRLLLPATVRLSGPPRGAAKCSARLGDNNRAHLMRRIFFTRMIFYDFPPAKVASLLGGAYAGTNDQALTGCKS